MTYLEWQDLDPKKPTATKITEGAQAYVARFRRVPTVVLVNAVDVCEVPGMTVQAVSHVRKHNFWFGEEGI